jgi:hypothetical protein
MKVRCSWLFSLNEEFPIKNKKKETAEEEKKLANGVYQKCIVNDCFNVLETLIYVFSGGLMT